MTEPLIFVNDIRAAGHCPRGIKRWFEHHKLDFRKFVKEGIPASTLKKTGCGLAGRIIDTTLARRTRGE